MMYQVQATIITKKDPNILHEITINIIIYFFKFEKLTESFNIKVSEFYTFNSLIKPLTINYISIGDLVTEIFMSIYSLTNSLNSNSYKDNFINLKRVLIDIGVCKSIDIF